MTHKTASIAIKLTCMAVLAACLSGCIIYVDHDDDLRKTPTSSDEKPAQTGSF